MSQRAQEAKACWCRARVPTCFTCSRVNGAWCTRRSTARKVYAMSLFHPSWRTGRGESPSQARTRATSEEGGDEGRGTTLLCSTGLMRGSLKGETGGVWCNLAAGRRNRSACASCSIADDSGGTDGFTTPHQEPTNDIMPRDVGSQRRCGSAGGRRCVAVAGSRGRVARSPGLSSETE